MYKAYASYFVSYLLSKIKKIEDIKTIILFGSVAKNEATKNSDVDIFVEFNKKTVALKKETEKILNEFYKSREAILFKSKGIENKINLIVGKIEEWGELKDSIEGTGIVLYGNYVSQRLKGAKYAIIFWNKIGKNRGAFLNKIYGFKIKNRKYIGVMDIHKGKKLGKSSIMIPIQYREEIVKLLKHYKVNAKIIEVYV